jgi:glycosyltransferase involved in cell wall biosynthesis
MPVVYALGDVFVLPSRNETWGLALNEAMASSRAIIASDKCGAAIDLIKEEDNGYIFKSGDVDDLTDKLIMISRNNVKKMGLSSLGHIKKFNFAAIAEAIEKSI